MNKFVIVCYRTDDQRHQILERIRTGARREINYDVGKIHERDYPDRRLIIWSAEARHAALQISRAHLQQKGGIVFDGLPFSRAIDPDSSWAPQLIRLLARMKPRNFFEHVDGDYCLAYYDKTHVVAFGDFMGLQPLFYYEREGVIAVSNRQRLLHRIVNEGGRVRINPMAYSWLISQDQIFGLESPFEGVKLLRPGTALRVRDGKVDILPLPAFHSPADKRGELTKDRIAVAVDAIMDHAEGLARLPFSDLDMDLTGGMDSRAVLAVALGSGLINRVNRVQTRGYDDTPDVEVASSLARKFNLPYSTRGPRQAPRDDAPANSANVGWHRLRLSARLLDGTVTPSSVPNRAPITLARLTGSGGEIFRPHVKDVRHRSLESREEAHRWVMRYQGGLDPFGLLKQEVRSRHAAMLRGMVDRYMEGNIPFDDMHYLIYTENRMPWWAGYTSANSGGQQWLMLLANRKAAEVMFSVDPVHKKTDRLHFEIMKAVDPRLVTHPFLANTWDERLAPFFGELDVPGEPFRTGQADNWQSRGRGWLLEFPRNEFDTMLEYVLESDSVLFEAVDRTRVEALRDQILAGKPRAAITMLDLVMMRLTEDDQVNGG